MPKLEEALYDYLSSDGGITDIVDDRIYYSRLPEGADLPAISWRRVDANRIYTYDPFLDTDAWVQARIQFDCWSRTDAEEAIRVGEALLAALSGYDGDMSGELIGSTFAVNEFDQYEPNTKIWHRILDFMVTYEDDVTTAS